MFDVRAQFIERDIREKFRHFFFSFSFFCICFGFVVSFGFIFCISFSVRTQRIQYHQGQARHIFANSCVYSDTNKLQKRSKTFNS